MSPTSFVHPIRRRIAPHGTVVIEEHRETLSGRPSGYFQLSFASAVPWKRARDGAMEWGDDFVAETGWQPDRIELFAGAVNDTQYSRPMKLAFKLVSMVTTGDKDTSRDYEYTDWDEVERFALEFAEFVESQSRRPPIPTVSSNAAVRRGKQAVLALVLLGIAGTVVRLASRRKRSRRRLRKPPGRRATAPGRDSEIEAETPEAEAIPGEE